MRLSPGAPVPVVLVLLAVAAPVAAHTVPDGVAQPHVRIVDQRLRTLFREGLRGSPTLRFLVSRLEESDVVVYVEPDPYGLTSFAGRLTFLSVVGELRYVVVRVTPLASPVQEIAMIGHELRHAVEVAERPHIVDQASMLREYMRIGYVVGTMTSGVAVDTNTAMEAGSQVAEEIRGEAKLSRATRLCAQDCARVPVP